MFYEVFIPSNGSDGFDVTITVEADNWMTALKSGLERTGQGADSIRNVMCDIQEDNTIHVTDASTARVFVLREVGDGGDDDATQEDDASASDTLLDLGAPNAGAAPGADEHDGDDVADFETHRMEPIQASPLATSSRTGDVSDYQSRERTSPRHRPPPGAPPPEVTGKFQRAPGPRAPQSGAHSPPPHAAPPPAVRQSGAVPTVQQSQDAAPEPEHTRTPTQPLAPSEPIAVATSASASGPPNDAAPPAAMARPAPEPKAAPAPIAETPPPRVEPTPIVQEAGDLDSDPIADLPDNPGGDDGLDERSWTSEDGRMRIGSSTFKALKSEDSEPKVVRETRAPSGQRQAIDIGRTAESVSQNALEEVFLEINQIHEGEMTMEQVINYVMDLSMSKIRAEAGSVMFADVNGRELYFATARGPKAQDVMEFRVPMTKGVVGFCAREGVSLAISDAEKDPRFFKEISEKLGYETRNICCAPIQFEGRVYGAIELMNNAQPFNNTEVNILTYIARQLAKFVNDLIMAREKI